MLLLPHEHPHAPAHHLLCKGEHSLHPRANAAQSGQSLIEHSYKADSDLSPAGWEYAERLKAAVISRRKALREERKARGENVGEESPLLVWTSSRRRAHHTAWPFVHAGYKVVQKPIMGEINP